MLRISLSVSSFACSREVVVVVLEMAGWVESFRGGSLETRRNGTTANNNSTKILNEKNGVEGTAVGGGKVRVEGI
jgi:hypothetical protein